MKKTKAAPRPKAAKSAKRQPREDMNQTAYRVMQETIRRSEQPFPSESKGGKPLE
jgi:hypothetical protein